MEEIPAICSLIFGGAPPEIGSDHSDPFVNLEVPVERSSQPGPASECLGFDPGQSGWSPERSISSSTVTQILCWIPSAIGPSDGVIREVDPVLRDLHREAVSPEKSEAGFGHGPRRGDHRFS